MKEWEVRGWNNCGEFTALCGGSEKSFPSARERRVFKEHGYELYVDGKPYGRETNKKKKVVTEPSEV